MRRLSLLSSSIHKSCGNLSINRNCPLKFSSFLISNSFATNATTTKVETPSQSTPESNSNTSTPLTTGQFYQDIVYRGRKDHLVSIKDLKKLLKMIQTPEEVKYAGLAVDWYQDKGFDFSEELNSLFIQKCVDNNATDTVTKRFLYAKGRIGSWSTPSTIYRLLSSLETKEDHQSILKLIQVLTPKGVRPDLRSFEIVFSSCIKLNSLEDYNQSLKIAEKLLSSDDYQMLIQKYPAPAAVAADSSSGEAPVADTAK